jgi:hypothetical protein
MRFYKDKKFIEIYKNKGYHQKKFELYHITDGAKAIVLGLGTLIAAGIGLSLYELVEFLNYII